MARKSTEKHGARSLEAIVSILSYPLSPPVPLVGRCGKGVNCWRLVGDYWLAGDYEKRVLRALFEKTFGTRFDIAGKPVVFHRIPAPLGEYAVEVFAEAARLGVIEYAVGRGWILHPSGAAASLAATLGAETVNIDEYRGRIKGKKIRLTCNPMEPRGSVWVLVESSGWVGVARILKREGVECLVKVKDMAPKGFHETPLAGLDRVLEENSKVLGLFAAEARDFIRRVYAKYQASRGRVYVAFSGGADSTALLVLTAETLSPERVVAVYADTGMEFPSTQRYVEKIASMLGVDLEIVKPSTNPLEEIAEKGLMSRENRWCTRILKLMPLKHFYERKRVKLVLDGARKWESTNRARTPRIGRNPLIPSTIRALPIYYWPRMLVQLFLHERKIPLNPLYSRGLVRIGCIMCPAMHLYELHLSYSLHPEWYRRIAEKLSSKTSITSDSALFYLLQGEWRYRDSSGT